MNYDNPSKTARQRQKSNLAKNIRTLKPEDTTRKPCFICGKWRSITHCHHVIEVQELALYCITHSFSYFFLPVKFVWLCPNHHEWLHRLSDNHPVGRWEELLSEISHEEMQQYKRLNEIQTDMYNEMYARRKLVEGVVSLTEQHDLILARIESLKEQEEAEAE